MSRLTGNEAKGLMEAYNAVYAPSFTTSLNKIYIAEEVSNLFEECLTEEFLSEAYHTVADYLVHNGFVPGYNTAELFMSEMALEDIDFILFETGILNEQYLIEAGFFQGLGAGADRLVNRAAGAVKRTAQTVSGAAQRAGQTAVRAGQAVAGGAVRAGQAVAGGVQRAGQAVQKAVTPVAQAVKGTAQRAVAAGQSALGSAGRAVQGAAQGAVRGATAVGQAVAGGAVRAGQAVAGGVQRAGQAVAGAAGNVARKVGQEVEISRRVGAGLPPTAGGGSAVAKTAPTAAKPTFQNSGGFGRYGAPSSQVKTSTPAPAAAKPTAPAAAAPKTSPSASGSLAKPTAAVASAPAAPAKPASTATRGFQLARQGVDLSKTSAPTPAAPVKKPASGIEDLRQMRKASQQRIMSQGGTPATPLVQSFDPFDVVMGHLIDEGYADSEEAALAIMANMSEEWRQDIIEGIFDFLPKSTTVVPGKYGKNTVLARKSGVEGVADKSKPGSFTPQKGGWDSMDANRYADERIKQGSESGEVNLANRRVTPNRVK